MHTNFPRGRVVKRTLLLASKFTETPSPRAAPLQRDRGSHELGVYRLLATRLEPSFDDGLERRRAFADAAKLDKSDENVETR